jgi:hypothetical protein
MTEPTIEERAKAIGWVPREQFRGDADKFVDAETYLTRGKEFIPFLRASNKRLEEQVGSLKGELESTKNLLRANASAIEELNKSTADQVRAAAEKAKAEALRELEIARKDGDVDAAVAAQQKADAATKTAEEAAKPKPKPNGELTNPPGWEGFIKDNPWWNEDPVMRAASAAVTAQLAAAGALAGLTIEQRWAKVASETKKRFGMDDNARRREDSRVEGSRATPEDRSGTGGGKSYADLPADAKAACDNPTLVNRLVGEGKKFKDIKAWRENYAETYFRSP